MTVPRLELDDRRFDDLVTEALVLLQGRTPRWTDLSPSDPGVVLVELFAYLTEQMIYQLNRVPEKAYREYLRLIGLTQRPPSAAVAELVFETDRPAAAPIAIPRGTRVAARQTGGAGEAPVFGTAAPVEIPVGGQSVSVLAHHCELVVGERLGTGTGGASQSFRVARPPIVASSGGELDLVVGVEIRPGEPEQRPGLQYEGRPFAPWQEVDSFFERAPGDRVFVVDRLGGRITFAPALLGPDDRPELMAAVPGVGHEIRVWYRRGGGPDGNVPAGAISELRDAIAGVAGVANPEAATGGRAAEPLEEALIRGPQALHAVQRAVTAQDYETLALRAGGAVARARAFAEASVWRHAQPGTVKVLLVPSLADARARATAQVLRASQTDAARDQVQAALDERRPLGIATDVAWASYKTVSVRARVIVRREEHHDEVRQRVLARLYGTISPLPDHARRSAGWRFGQPLRASQVFDMVLAEPGVRYVDNVRLLVEHVPGQDVAALAADEFQPHTCYAGAGGELFRTLNDAASWELVAAFEGEAVRALACHPENAGLVAAMTKVQDGSRVHVSADAGETWDVSPLPKPEFDVNAIAWSARDGAPVLLLAGDGGLFELALRGERTFLQIAVTPEQTQGFSAVAVGIDALGARNVAVAAQGAGRVWLSAEGGAPGTFRDIGLPQEDVRVLAVQHVGPRTFLWAGAAAAGAANPGSGAWRRELRGRELRGEGDAPEGWVAFGREWNAGSCWDLAFREGSVFAATHHGGVLVLDPSTADAAWRAPGVNSGLPLRDPAKFLFEQLSAVATSPSSALVLAGGSGGVRASGDGSTWELCSQAEFAETVALPDTWLFVSGEHDIAVQSEGEAAR